jgi:beta-lactamase regulating signal transducer with metallopeptidase domain
VATTSIWPIEPFILAAWLAGVAVLSLRLAGGWWVARGFTTRGTRPAATEIEKLAKDVAIRLGLTRLVRLFESTTIVVPVTMGWIRPVVLFPASALSGLSNAQVEALLAHELAHVRRHDYVVNLLQSVVETLLFYHPAVWWVSRTIRTEREHCCDDLAVSVCDRVVYVRALSDLAALGRPRLALAATDGSLVGRVRRLLGEPRADRDHGAGWLSAMIAVFLIGAVPVVIAAWSRADARVEPVPQAAKAEVAASMPVVEEPAGSRQALADESVPAAHESLAAPQDPVRELERIRQEELAVERARRDAQAADERQRLGIELQRREAEFRTARAQLVGEIDRLRREYQRVSQQVEKGLASERALSDLQAQLRVLDLKMAGLEQEYVLGAREVELQRASSERTREFEARLAEMARAREQVAGDVSARHSAILSEYERMRAEYASLLEQKKAGASAGVDRQIAAIRDQLQRYEVDLESLRRAMGQTMREVSSAMEIEQRLALAELARQQLDRASAEDYRQLTQRREERRVADTAPIAADATARAGDLVVLDLQDEPDLPRVYAVQPNGAVRLPLIGSVIVQGLTTRQVEDLIRREFTDRKLAAGASVRVTVRRAP